MFASIINVMYCIFCAVDDVGGDTFQVPQNNVSSDYETTTDFQGTLYCTNDFKYILIVVYSFLCIFSFEAHGWYHVY